MTPLEEILELYREALKVEDVLEYEDVDIEPPDIDSFKNIEPKEIKEIEVPEEGDIIEVFPSLDGLGMIFLIFRIYKNGYVELLPMSKFWELATPEDVLIQFEGETYIVQTDLGFEVPEEDFPKRFGNRKVFLLGKLTPEQMKEVEDVYEGRKKGTGGMWGGPKEEFKTLESRRYFSLFAQMIEEEEKLLELSAFFEKHREYALAAAGEEKTWGEKEGIRWFYDSEEKRLILTPEENLVGKRKRILLEADGDKVVLFEGELPKKIEIPLENYSHSLLERSLRVEDV